MKIERNRAGNKYTLTPEDEKDEKLLDRVGKLEEENKKLKEFKTKREESRFYFKAQMERAEPKTASEAEDLQKAKEMFEKLYRQELNCLEEENKKLKEERDLYKARNEELNEDCFGLAKENKKLKSDLANIQCEFGFECDECEFWKREMKKHKPNLIKEEYVFNLGDYDYMILTSTTPQLKIIKKNNKGISTFTVK